MKTQLVMKSKYVLVILCLLLLLSAFVSCKEAYSISFEESSYTIKAEESFTPKVLVSPSNMDYTLSIANNTIASTDGKKVTAIRTGKTTITAKSGDLTATCELIVSDKSNPSDAGNTTVDTYIIYGYLVNYELAGLTTDLFSIDRVYANSIYLTNPPKLDGYTSNGWYTDEACSQKFNANDPVTSDLNLYFTITANENSYTINTLGQISGLAYPDLPHSELNLPTELRGKTITGVADDAFKEDTYLTAVTIPASYTYIGKNAFAGCINLKTFTIPDDSKLAEIGDFAFSITSSQQQVGEPGENEDPVYETVLNDNPCDKLTELNLPDSVAKIGHSAFGYCTSLKLNGIPSALEEVQYAAFLGTKINNIDFSNVQIIRSFAFQECLELTTVTNTQDVELCEAEAFIDSKLYLEQEEKDIIYAGTMVVGCYRQYGVLGGGKVYLKDDTTLISNGAINAAQQNEVTIYFNSLDSGKLLYIGKDAFLNEKGVCLVVPENQFELYKKEYTDYEERFCTEYVINVTNTKTVQNTEGKTQIIGDVNFGKHTLLKFSDTKYYYDLFTVCESTPGFKSSPTEIRFSLFGNVADYIQRVNTGAINLGKYGGNLTYLETHKVREFAPLAIVNCFRLATIDLRGAQYIPTIDSNSFQFSSVGKEDYVDVNKIGNPNLVVSDCSIVGATGTTDIKMYVNSMSENEYVYRKLNLIQTTAIKLSFNGTDYSTLSTNTDVEFSYVTDNLISLKAGYYDVYFNSETGKIRITSSLPSSCKILIKDESYSDYSKEWELTHKSAFSHIVKESELLQ